MKQPNYEEAMKRIEQIASQMEDGSLNLEELTSSLTEAQKLIKLCRDKLTKTDEEVKKLLENENQNNK